MATLPIRPGKIIAVHVAYASRANERGRWPQAPTYFLKASSSVAESGADLVRPAGTKLMAFEAEIALIIGKPAYRVPLAQAWDHVAYVTASNDLGIYDYRPQDKGSNIRSKSRDGYTPIGPELIDAREVDPTELRIRAWVNGELAQEDSTDAEALIFSLPQFVADLSQHFTLEEGDVILTGTPTGSTVITPGDTVEIEVDAPAQGLTSGRLSNTVVDGPGDFDPELGLLPVWNEKQAEDAYGTRELAGLPESKYAISEQLRAKLMAAPTAGLSAQLRSRGLNQVSIEGVASQTVGHKIVGPARTLRYLPEREDLFATHGGGFNAQKQAFDDVKTGEVIVIEARRQSESGTMGDILALRAQALGAAGIVTDGGVRDYQQVKEIGLPVFTQGPHPAVLGRRHVPWDTDLAIACGNATVVPGDIIVGDDDGVIVIPRDIAEEVADAALAKEHQDEWVADQVAAGHKLDGMFPPTGKNKEAYQEYLAENPVEQP